MPLRHNRRRNRQRRCTRSRVLRPFVKLRASILLSPGVKLGWRRVASFRFVRHCGALATPHDNDCAGSQVSFRFVKPSASILLCERSVVSSDTFYVASYRLESRRDISASVAQRPRTALLCGPWRCSVRTHRMEQWATTLFCAEMVGASF